MKKKSYEELKVAVAHYWFITWRGGEKVVQAILDIFPQADVYTLFYDERTCGPYLQNHTVTSSKLDIPLLRKRYQKVFPLYPTGVRSLKLKQEYDLIISSESGPIKGLEKGSAKHLCYIHTPMRYCWEHMDEYLHAMNPLLRGSAKKAFLKLREYDKTTIDNVDRYVANSQNVRNRVRSYYQREAGVVYPPIANSLFTNSLYQEKKQRTKDYFLSFGAITPYKRIDLLVDTFNSNGLPLHIIGEGAERERLERKAERNISFFGALPWNDVQDQILGARALLFPGEEDFGMIPLEVMSYGLPVIAYGKGGALETVVEQKGNPASSTGLFFHQQTPSSIQEALETFISQEQEYNQEYIRNHAHTFNEDMFKMRIKNEIDSLLAVDRR